MKPLLQISHGNTAAHAAEHGDKVLGRICAAIAGDEARHEKAYIKIVDALFERCGMLVSVILLGLHLCNGVRAAAHLLKLGRLRVILCK